MQLTEQSMMNISKQRNDRSLVALCQTSVISISSLLLFLPVSHIQAACDCGVETS